MKTTTLFLVKKTLLVLGIMTLANLAKGQEIITDFCHENGGYFTGVYLKFVETTDKCLIVESWLATEYAPGTAPIGIMFYKFSADGIVRDSLLFEYDSVYDDGYGRRYEFHYPVRRIIQFLVVCRHSGICP